MKKTILSAAIISATSFGAVAEVNTNSVTPDPLLDPRDAKGWEQLDKVASKLGNDTIVQQMHDIMEYDSTFYNGIEYDSKNEAMDALLADAFSNVDTHREAAAAFAVLNNINVANKDYDSLADQLINSWGYGSEDFTETFNEWNKLDETAKKKYIASAIERNNGDFIGSPVLVIDPINAGDPVDDTPTPIIDPIVREPGVEPIDPVSQVIKFDKAADKALAAIKENKQYLREEDYKRIIKKAAFHKGYDMKVEGDLITFTPYEARIDGEELQPITMTVDEFKYQASAKADEIKANSQERQQKREDYIRENAGEDLIPSDPENPTDPIVVSPKKAALEAVVQNEINERQTEASTQTQINELYALGTEQINENKLAIDDLYKQVDRLDEKLDGVMAGTHAVNNARPFLSGTGQTAVGVGVGYAGDAGAVAVGAAHSFTDNWSASATLNVTTGSYSEVSGGAGVQYVF